MSSKIFTIKHKEHQKPAPLFISEADAATKLGIHTVTLRRWRWEGRNSPPFVRMGPKLVSYPIDQFNEWVEKVRRGEIFAGSKAPKS